jgi:hypothetical protein
MKKIGIIVLVIGLALTLFTGLSFATREKVIDLGKFHISAEKNHAISWSPIVGVIAVVTGLYLMSRKNTASI